MNSTSYLISDSAKPPAEREVWFSSCEALRQVSDAYYQLDNGEYPTDEIKQAAVMEMAVSAVLRRLVQGSLLARTSVYSLKTLGDDLPRPAGSHIIPDGFWGLVQLHGCGAITDWIAGDFFFQSEHNGVMEVEGLAYGVEFERSALPAIARNTAAALADCPSPKTGGAPRKWDWDGGFLHLAAMAHRSPDGLLREDGGDPNQSDIGNYLQDWFIGTRGESPSDSQLRAYGKRFVEDLNTLKLLNTRNPKAA